MMKKTKYKLQQDFKATKTYKTPTLKYFGKVSSLTSSGTGISPEGQSGMGMA